MLRNLLGAMLTLSFAVSPAMAQSHNAADFAGWREFAMNDARSAANTAAAILEDTPYGESCSGARLWEVHDLHGPLVAFAVRCTLTAIQVCVNNPNNHDIEGSCRSLALEVKHAQTGQW